MCLQLVAEVENFILEISLALLQFEDFVVQGSDFDLRAVESVKLDLVSEVAVLCFQHFYFRVELIYSLDVRVHGAGESVFLEGSQFLSECVDLILLLSQQTQDPFIRNLQVLQGFDGFIVYEPARLLDLEEFVEYPLNPGYIL